MSNDPANTRVQQCSATGLSRETTFNQTYDIPLPSKGRTRQYAAWQRERTLKVLDWTTSY